MLANYQRDFDKSVLEINGEKDYQPYLCAEDMKNLRERREAVQKQESSRTATPTKTTTAHNSKATITVASVEANEEAGTGTVKADQTSTDSSGREKKQQRSFRLVKEDGEWRMCGLIAPLERSGGGSGSTSAPRPTLSIPRITIPSISIPSLSIPTFPMPTTGG
ncbi:DUF4878 domain-containing protein [Crossiella sp. CA-258035]|nr:DUF4878 domain-containing protein [Crossiella sp. CA-258035]WHT23642.1 DUF4878 domain-containing protein [Crossiella sp. CA-258035]